jgi:hypothetical protein
VAAKEDRVDFAVTADRQVGAPPNSFGEVGQAGVLPDTVHDVERVWRDPVLLVCVGVVDTGETVLGGGVDEGFKRGCQFVVAALADRQWSGSAVELLIASRCVL